MRVLERWFGSDDPSAAPREQDERELREAVETISTENARLRQVIGHCPKGIAVLDENGALTGYNHEFAALLGTRPELGAPVSKYFAETDRELLRTVIARAGTSQRAAAVLRIEREGSDRREIEFLAATLPSGDRSIGVVLAGDDRTVDIDNEHARLTVDGANRRDTFALAFSAVRKEVETQRLAALEALRATANVSGDNGACIERAIAALDSQATALQVHSDRWSARPDGVCDVSAAAQRAVRLAWIGRARRLVTVTAQTEKRLPARIAENDLVQVLCNLIGHSIRTIERIDRFGWVTIGAEPNGNDTVAITIRDNGPGTPPRILQSAFVLGDAPEADDESMGLVIARSIIEARGGSIRALSEPDHGTTLVITVPAA
jgi:PAS domain S-box-containing protein